ncbi:hypothetical protein ABZ901_10395 [Actinacidiphila alni]|uniref:hypothetical protein n=1 Tax=Actinacidiphila alni TaxID=380248 RepID=UPI0033CC6D51
MTVAGVASTLIMLCGLSTALVLHLRSRTRRRQLEQERLAASWEALIRERDSARSEGAHLVQVLSVYQRAQRGSKAVVRWCDTGATQDAWFWGRHVPPGAYLLLRGHTAFGPHNHNPDVLYVHPHEVLRQLPAHAPAAWRSHNQPRT